MEKINRPELVDKLMEAVPSVSKKDMTAVVGAIEDVVIALLKENPDKGVNLPGLGYFYHKAVPARNMSPAFGGGGRNIPAHTRIAFKLSNKLSGKVLG